jgi:hypothetical protein
MIVMSLALAYWILMLIWLVFALALHGGFIGGYGVIGNAVLLFVLFLLLGWKVFGPPLHG